MISHEIEELEHSKILRSSIRLGIFNFTDLLYKNKYWKCLSYSVGPNGDTNDIINQQSVYNYVSPISYCDDCILFAIREFGYGYFKRAWWRSSWCRVHRKKLNVLTSVKTLLSEDILGGFSSKNSSLISLDHYHRHYYYKKSFYLKLIAFYGELHIDVAGDYGIPQNIKRDCLFNFTPCFQTKFLSWCLSHHDELLRKLNHNTNIQTFFYMFRADSSIILRYDLERMKDYAILFFNIFCQEPNNVFKNFIESNAYHIEDGNLLKASGASCSICPHMEWTQACSESRDICRMRLIEPVLRFQGNGLVRIGSSYHQLAKDNSAMLAKENQIDTIYYMDNGSYICDLEAKRQSYTELTRYYEKYTLLGWRDVNDDISGCRHLSVDYPLYSEKQVTLVPCHEVALPWPEIQFDTYVNWMDLTILNHQLKDEIEDITAANGQTLL